MSRVTITVRGVPAPQGSKRHVGNGRMVEMSKAVGPWREAVRAETQHAVYEDRIADFPCFTGPVEVLLTFWLARPKGHYRTGRNAHLLRDGAPAYPAGKPDVDKLARAVLDGLTEGGAWKDDSQVVALHAVKLYANAGGFTGCVIKITERADAREDANARM